jgi:hypothetical protein
MNPVKNATGLIQIILWTTYDVNRQAVELTIW